MTTWINVNKQGVARNAKLGTNARLKDVRPRPNSLSLPTRLSTELFASAKPVQLAADEVLFHALDTGDGCYRIEEGCSRSRCRRAQAPNVY
jgi:hypothetical protein